MQGRVSKSGSRSLLVIRMVVCRVVVVILNNYSPSLSSNHFLTSQPCHHPADLAQTHHENFFSTLGVGLLDFKTKLFPSPGLLLVHLPNPQPRSIPTRECPQRILECPPAEFPHPEYPHPEYPHAPISENLQMIPWCPTPDYPQESLKCYPRVWTALLECPTSDYFQKIPTNPRAFPVNPYNTQPRSFFREFLGGAKPQGIAQIPAVPNPKLYPENFIGVPAPV